MSALLGDRVAIIAMGVGFLAAMVSMPLEPGMSTPPVAARRRRAARLVLFGVVGLSGVALGYAALFLPMAPS